MSRRTLTDKDRSQVEKLLDKVRRRASDDVEGNVVFNSRAVTSMLPSLGHNTLTLSFMRSRLDTLEQLQKAVLDLIKYRLEAQNVHVPQLDVTLMTWCLPQE